MNQYRKKTVSLNMKIFLQLENPYQKSMYTVLAAHSDKSRNCSLTIKELAAASGMGIVKATATLSELEKHNIITKKRQYLSNGGCTANCYTLHDTNTTLHSCDQ